jgi:hypothetical protein
MTPTATNPLELLERMGESPASYRQQLRIEVSGDVVRYADVAADWQEADFCAMDAAWLRCIGRTKAEVKPMRAWLERPRGASKTHDLACMACWGLRFAPRRVRFIWCAGDVDQARLGIKAMQQLCELNPWLGLEVQRNIVRNPATGSELEVLTSDAATGYGQLVDAVLVDEICNWADTDSAQRFWQMVASTISKKRNCLCVCISNAGRVDSWQWDIREAIREDENWYFHALQTVPPWISEAQLAEQKRLLPPNAYARLWENKWSSGTDTGLSPADVEACCVLHGPLQGRSFGHDAIIAACDLGWRHDRTGLVVLAMSFERREISLAHCESWHPHDHGGELPLEVVEDEIHWLHRQFRFDQLVFDPREATGLSQRLVNAGVPCARASLTPEMQDGMAKILLQAFNQRWVKLYRDPDLIRDLLSLEVVDRTIGLKLQAARTAQGHSDLGFAFAIALFAAVNYTPEVAEEVLIA